VRGDENQADGIGNPYQYLYTAIEDPARMLYSDSDFEDHDLQVSPISTTIGGLPVIITGGKVGIVYALNARSGALLWKTPVGEHDGRDNGSVLMLEHKFKIARAPQLIAYTLNDAGRGLRSG
jgi:hypothetical protein